MQKCEGLPRMEDKGRVKVKILFGVAVVEYESHPNRQVDEEQFYFSARDEKIRHVVGLGFDRSLRVGTHKIEENLDKIRAYTDTPGDPYIPYIEGVLTLDEVGEFPKGEFVLKRIGREVTGSFVFKGEK